MFTVAPIAEMVLDETPVESQNSIETQVDPNGCALYFRNPKNVFVKGWAFGATSLAAEFAETSRRRAFGRATVDAAALHGRARPSRRRLRYGQRKVAAFSGAVEVKAKSETTIAS